MNSFSSFALLRVSRIHSLAIDRPRKAGMHLALSSWLRDFCMNQRRSTEGANISGGLYMIRKLKSGKYRLYSRKKDPKTGKHKNLGTFDSREEAEKHERAVQYFKHHG